jgi:hypothetical protein
MQPLSIQLKDYEEEQLFQFKIVKFVISLLKEIKRLVLLRYVLFSNS